MEGTMKEYGEILIDFVLNVYWNGAFGFYSGVLLWKVLHRFGVLAVSRTFLRFLFGRR